MFMYNDNLPDEDLKFLIGWAQVGVFSFVILVNSIGILKTMVKDTYLLIKKKWRVLRSKFKSKEVVRVDMEAHPQ